ncbi:unnamed protein product, partial [marine sediment metagenome]
VERLRFAVGIILYQPTRCAGYSWRTPKAVSQHMCSGGGVCSGKLDNTIGISMPERVYTLVIVTCDEKDSTLRRK